MDVLIIGFSSLVQRRVLSSLVASSEIGKIHIATRQSIARDVVPPEKRGQVWSDYEAALSEVEPGLAYISLPNHLHGKWARRALDAGCHVVVDKPSFLSLGETEDLVALAKRKGLCLAEANVWHYHPLAQAFRKAIMNEGHEPLMVFATFSSPPMDAGNFRYKPQEGGGVIYDRAPYLVSCGRIIFNSTPDEVVCKISSYHFAHGVDESCSIMMHYKNRGVLHGFLSIGAEYKNSLAAIGPSYYLEAERIFTPPADYRGTILLKKNNKTESLAVPEADIFGLFFKDLHQSLQNKTYGLFSDLLLQDGQILSRLLMNHS